MASAMDGAREFCALRARSFRDRFCLEEASGALGDLGTLIPLLSACAKLGTIRMGPAVFWMGVFNIISAVQWDIPMPVQPMKSIAAVAISDGMSPGAFAASGIITGCLVTLLGMTRTIEAASRIIPTSVIAGMQVGLGVKMAGQGCSYWHTNPWFDGIDCKLTALLTLLLTLALMIRTRLPTALIVFSLGTVLTVLRMIDAKAPFEFGLLQFSTTVPTGEDWLNGLVEGALPQLPLTTMNSCISVCALSVSLFGDPSTGGRGVSRVSVASSVGVMNLVGCWFGGMPSCHGAGGLAGQHKFGARGGMAILMLGVAKVALALAIGQTLDGIITFYPQTVLGVMLLFAGVELASVGARSLLASASLERDIMPCFVTAGAYIGTKNMALGVTAGLLTAGVQSSERWRELLGHRPALREQDEKAEALQERQKPPDAGPPDAGIVGRPAPDVEQDTVGLAASP